MDFHHFASEWFEEVDPGIQPATSELYRWQLSHHLLPFFRAHALAEIAVGEIDRYRAFQLSDGRLAASSINKTIRLLGQILDVAVERGFIEVNPMWINRRRRLVRAAPPRGTYLDRAVHIGALLDAAGELDDETVRGRLATRRAILSTLVFAGLRIGELLDLHWSELDLSDSRLTIRRGKSPAAAREIQVLPALKAELVRLRESSPHAGHGDLVFPTRAGRPQSRSNVRSRILRPSCERANRNLARAGRAALPSPVTHHSLRRTFASMMFALGSTAPEVMAALGHTEARLTVTIYARSMNRDPDELPALRSLAGLA